MSEDPITEVRRLLIEKHGIPAVDLTPQARILQDLGVDGDDAAELFNDLNARYGTNFAALKDDWREFFNTEGASPKAILLGCPVLLICAGASGALAAYAHLPKPLAMVLAFIMLIGGSWLWSRFFGRDLRPLTVAGLAEIVERGEWPADPYNVR